MKIKSFKPKLNKPTGISNQLASLRSGSSGGAPKLPVFSKFMKMDHSKPNLSGEPVKLIPLGGIGDVTKNMYVYEYKDDIIICDCGVGFPDEDMLGIDLVIPDISYLKDKKHKIRGIIISHAHDDHIGGLPYIWPELDVPIYSQKLTCGFIKAKFTEHKLPKDKIKEVGLDDVLNLGAFTVSFYRVSHSVPDSTGIVMKTPVGTLVHQADFKIDWTPVNGQVPDVGRIAQVGNEGVTFMTIDCLRSEKAGYTPSEKTIEPTFSMIEEKTKGKLIITLMTSNITRIQQAINVAVRSGRKVALFGRSMETSFQTSRDLGYLDIPAGVVIGQEELKRFPDDKLLLIMAGSLGQPGSALSRVANNDHKYVRLNKEDTVVISADPMPSAETAQEALIDSLSRFGCTLYYSGLTPDLHVSGHAASEEIKMMINLLKPRSVMPMGGNFKHIRAFEKLAKSLGYGDDQIIITNEERIIEIYPNMTRFGDKIQTSNIYVDGLGIGDVGSIVLRDRQVMSEEGVVMVVAPVNRQTGQLVTEPDIIQRGFIFEQESEDLIEASREIVKSCFSGKQAGHRDWRIIREDIENSLEKFFFQELKRKPLIVTLVVEV